MTITIGWWIVPVALVVAALVLWERGSRQPGMLGGVVEFLLGAGLMIGAIASCLVRLFR